MPGTVREKKSNLGLPQAPCLTPAFELISLVPRKKTNFNCARMAPLCSQLFPLSTSLTGMDYAGLHFQSHTAFKPSCLQTSPLPHQQHNGSPGPTPEDLAVSCLLPERRGMAELCRLLLGTPFWAGIFLIAQFFPTYSNQHFVSQTFSQV